MHLSGGHDTVLRWFRNQQAIKLAATSLDLSTPEPDVEIEDQPEAMKKEGIWVGPGKKFQVFRVDCTCTPEPRPVEKAA